MRITSWPGLPTPPRGLDPTAQAYLSSLHRELTLRLQEIYEDISKGQSTLTTFAAAPTATQVTQNQPVLRTDAGHEAIYVNIAGTMKSVALS